MTTSKDYRSDADDGVLTALLLGPVTVASMLYGTLISEYPNNSLYPRGWLIEAPKYLYKSMDPIRPRDALLDSRRSLVQLSTLCAFVLLTHMCTSRLANSKKVALANGSTSNSESERKVRKGMRSWNFVCYATLIPTVAVTFHVACDVLDLEIWKGELKLGTNAARLTFPSLDLSYFDVAVISSVYQFSIYVMIRLSHGGFTLGEVGLVSLGCTVLFMETVNLTIANVCLSYSAHSEQDPTLP